VKPAKLGFEASADRDTVLREVEQVLTLARSVSLGPEFDDIIRTAVERATDRLMAATRRRTARLAALSAIQQTVAGGFDLSAIMAGVYEHLRQILDAPSFLVAAYDAASATMQCGFAVADGVVVPDARFVPVMMTEGPVSQVLRSGQPLVRSEGRGARGDVFPLPRQSSSLIPQSTILVPMRKGEEVIGVMQAQSYRNGAYGAEDVEFLSTIANQTAMALENTRLYQEALRRSREVEALLAASQELGAELDPEQVISRVVEAAAHLVDAEVATIGIAAHHGLHFDRIWQDGGWRQVDAVARPDDATFERCLAGQPLLDNRPGPEAAGPLSAALPPLQSRLAVPVLGGEQRVLGVIALFNKRNRDGFAARDLDLTAAFASHAATALEKANAYRAMEQSRNHLQTLMDRSWSAILVLDPNSGGLRDLNAAAAQLLGRDREALLGLPVFDVSPESDHAAWRTILAEAPAGGDSIQRELHVLSQDGAAIPLDMTATRLDVDDAPALVCLARDRRPRIRQEEAERLRALGEMASGVAHDFNNLLGVILGRSDLMIGRLPPGESATHVDLDVVRQAALDGAETVKRLQAFSGVARLTQKGSSDVNRVLRDAVEFTRPRWKDAAQQRGVTIDVVVEPGEVPPAAGGAPELREVLVNLLFNAVDAMPHGGHITLRSRAESGRVFISVADTGVGMPEAVRRKVFEPFFTTKGSRGAGLGLSASYGIISRMGGRISVESAPYQGTTFTIDLPAGEVRPAAPSAPKARSAPLTLLLVDDEPQMLRTTKMMLEIEGHKVVAVGGGRGALEAIEKDAFDAVLTDLGMPEINGLQLAETLRARGHMQPVLLITGWGLELESDRVLAVGVTDILPKPFDGEKLRAKLAAITSDPPSRSQELVPAGRT
jgi:PAS domain S-box-containing protein